MCTAGNVGKSLVDRNSFYEGREITDDSHCGIAEPLVIVEVSTDESKPWAKFSCLPSRHSAADSKDSCFVGGSEHNSSSDGDGLSAQ